MYATTDELIAAVRRKGRIPDGDPTYTDAAILAEADDVISTYIVPALSSLRQGFFVVVEDIAITAGTASYTVPKLAAGDSLESVRLLNTDGTEFNLARIENIEQTGVTTQGGPYAYTVQGTNITLLPPPDGTQPTLRLRYTQRRRKLVPVASCALVASFDHINYAGGQLVVTDQPATITSGAVVDLVSPIAPYLTVFTDVALNVSAGGTAYLGSSTIDVTDGATVGDYLCVTGETPVIQLPVELHAPVADLTAAAILSQMGYGSDAQSAMSRGGSGVSAFSALAAPRVKDQPIKLVNRGSLMRSRGWGRYGR